MRYEKSPQEIAEDKLYAQATQEVMKRYWLRLREYRGNLITYDDLADALNCSIRTVYRAFADGVRPEHLSTDFVDRFIKTMNISFIEFYNEVAVSKEHLRKSYKSEIPKLIIRGVPNKKVLAEFENKRKGRE